MNERRKPYPFDVIEPKWQALWDERRLFHALNPGDPDFDPARPKYYVLDMFPYPSGSGLHVGHPEGYTATDIIARYKRLRGFNVLHPMGWDAFGLPAEQYAIRTGQHPEITTRENIARFKTQLERIGFSYDWEREINTSDPAYFRWTQWIFLQIYQSWFNPATQKADPISTYTGHDPDSVRLAYVAEVPVNWCPELGTVLANEEVIDGKSEVGGFPVVKRPMRQWMLRITAFAERLIDELEPLDWPEGIKLLQRNWIGKSEGAEVRFAIAGHDGTIAVFTTRPDTLYGATYMVLAPEHPLVRRLTTNEQSQIVSDYCAQIAAKSDLERTDLAKEKTGVFTGACAINPVNNERIPIWIADYVLLGYGTGAIMAVPAHDERDLEFARKFDLPIVEVVQPPNDEPAIGFVGHGVAINSPLIDGLTTSEAKREITAWLAQRGLGWSATSYKLRDWLFSRQRYWGEPFPIVWENGRHRSLGETELPLIPPPLEDFKPTGTGEPPLARAQDWVRYSETATRELNTMPQWAGSCWYYLRFCDPGNAERFVSENAERYWMTGETAPLETSVSLELRNLFEIAKNFPHAPHRTVTLAAVTTSEAVELRRQTGLDFIGYHHCIDNYALRHILKEHGDDRRENAREQVSIGLRDILRIPEILRAPDRIEFGRVTGRGRQSLLYVKESGGAIYYVEEILQSAGRLMAKTLYKRRATGKRAITEASAAQTSETFRRVAKSIEASFPSVNQKHEGGVDLYVGGTEHAVLHLLYARFWHKVLFDLGHLTTNEPFQRLVNQGIILGEDGRKMSKRWGNVIDPLDVIADYGADAFRCYEMFMGPLEQMKPWSMTGVEGVSRFLARVWRLLMEENQAGEWILSSAVVESAPDKAQLKVMHATTKKVTEDIEALSFNTAIAQMMIFVNAFTTAQSRPLVALRTLLVLLNPFAPHLSSELWETLGHKFPILPDEITSQPWPEYQAEFLVEDEVEIALQVNGKVRDRIQVALTATSAELEALALVNPRVQEFIAGLTVRKVVVIPKKLVNVVAN
ncbi:MAG: leucine--tRNA ligase [Chthoniobacterales bacterium]|nr:leucine--tRNA ligase [Chthoniobacterales bacterium]